MSENRYSVSITMTRGNTLKVMGIVLLEKGIYRKICVKKTSQCLLRQWKLSGLWRDRKGLELY